MSLVVYIKIQDFQPPRLPWPLKDKSKFEISSRKEPIVPSDKGLH